MMKKLLIPVIRKFVRKKYPLVEYSQSEHKRMMAVYAFSNKIETKIYKLQPNPCLCQNNDQKLDICIAEKASFAIPVKTMFCKKCGLMRSKKILDKKSTILFYKNDYRNIYTICEDETFSHDLKRGEMFFDLIKKNNILPEIKDILEIGCGSGANLLPLLKNEKNCIGYDLGTNYLRKGKNLGLDLRYGELYDVCKNSDEQDLIILSDVLEHLVDPIDAINTIIKKIRPLKFLLVKVPGLFSRKRILQELQNAHVIQYFYKKYLEVFFEHLNLKVIYGDEICTFILQKPIDWQENTKRIIYSKKLDPWIKKIENHLIDCSINLYYPKITDIFKRGVERIIARKSK
jgi:2-polyprenyl-3-methyl-5-hydroxy-6-metoxy-1,4-benzoquinol methylase